jgi:hypothetical protein
VQTITLCTESVFSTTTNLPTFPWCTPISLSASRPVDNNARLNAGSLHALATMMPPAHGRSSWSCFQRCCNSARVDQPMDQCLHEDFEQLLVAFQVLFQIHDALFEGTLVFFFFDLEKVIVVAALFAVVFGYHVHGFNGPRGHQRNAFHVLIESLLQVTHAGFDVFPLRLL